MSFQKYTEALRSAKNSFKKLQTILCAGGQTALFRKIRNIFIKEWGGLDQYQTVSQDFFPDLKPNTISKIIKRPDITSQDIVAASEAKKKKTSTRIREDAKLWFQIMEPYLVKKSGEKSFKSLRSQYSKNELYRFFQNGWYAMALDLQIFNDPTLLVEAENAGKTGTQTRFQRNICSIQRFKTDNKVTGCIQLKPMTTDSPAPQIECVDIRTFFRHLKKIGVSIYFDFVPHNCDLCNEIPKVDMQIRDIKEGKIKLVNHEKEMTALKQHREALSRHEAQLAVQRNEIERIRENLMHGQALVITDFAGHYSVTNQKLYQLIFVIYCRAPNGSLRWTYYSTWGAKSDGKADWAFVVKSWETLFTLGVFKNFEEIFLARDNGGHFRNYNVVKYESEIGSLWGTTFRVRSYAPRHGYSVAEGVHPSLSSIICTPAGVKNHFTL